MGGDRVGRSTGYFCKTAVVFGSALAATAALTTIGLLSAFGVTGTWIIG